MKRPDAIEVLAEAVWRRLRPRIDEVVRAAIAQEERSPRLMDRNALAETLCLSASTIDRYRREGMPAVRVGGSYRYDFDEVRGWLASRAGDASFIHLSRGKAK